LERQREEERDSDVDSGEEEGRARKRVRVTKKNAKVVKKRWEEPPGLTYVSVEAELEEEPLAVGIVKLYFNKVDSFRLIFEPEEGGVRGQGWQNKPYLHTLKMIKDHLEKEDVELVVKRLRRLFDLTCHCVPNVSRDRWLVNSRQSKFKPGWIAFDGNGDQIDCSSYRVYLAKEAGSS
jgi:hypothetical protein